MTCVYLQLYNIMSEYALLYTDAHQSATSHSDNNIMMCRKVCVVSAHTYIYNII